MTSANFGNMVDDSMMNGQPLERTVQQLIDKVAELQKQMEFQLGGKLDTSNISEIGGWIVDAAALKSDDGDVGFSTEDTTGDDIRIWAGNVNPAAAPFRVYESGLVIADSLTLVGTGEVVIGPTTKFEPGYDPTTKETPEGALAKANAAQSAAQSAASAEIILTETRANAYADGVVTVEESRAIADAQAKLDLAKADAQAKADAAQAAAVSLAATDATTKMDQAKANAAAAQTTADAATSKLADIASDAKLTPGEKTDTKLEWDAIVSEKPLIDTQATNYGITTEKTTYTNAYNALSSYITPLLADLTATSDIVGATFRSTFKAYYDARITLLNKVVTAAQAAAQAASVPNGVKFDNSVLIGSGNGIKVMDGSNNLRVQLGQYLAGKYGLLIKNKAGTATVLDEDGIMQSYSLQEADNVDVSFPLKLKFYIPDQTLSIKNVLLNFSREAFRAYSKSAAAGGGSTTATLNNSTVSTTTGNISTNLGGWISITTDGAGGHDHGAITSSAGAHSHGGTTSSAGSHSHGGSAGSHNHGNAANANTAPSISSDGAHTHSISTDTASQHTHSIGAAPDHIHSVGLPGHNHSFDINHTHNISLPSHTHAIDYGIFEGTLPTNIAVKVNNVTTHSGLNTDQANLNVSANCIIGWNTIEISSAQLGRINATVFVQTFMST